MASAVRPIRQREPSDQFMDRQTFSSPLRSLTCFVYRTDPILRRTLLSLNLLDDE